MMDEKAAQAAKAARLAALEAVDVMVETVMAAWETVAWRRGRMARVSVREEKGRNEEVVKIPVYTPAEGAMVGVGVVVADKLAAMVVMPGAADQEALRNVDVAGLERAQEAS